MGHFRLGVVSVMGITAAAALAACGSGGTTSPPAGSTSYVTRSVVSIPGVPPATGTFSFDISFIDLGASQYYLADRTTAGVDVVNTTSGQYVLTAGAGSFTGLGIGTPAAANTGGPNGVVPVGNGIVFAGDGNSTLKVVNVTSGTLVATVPTVNPYHGANLPCGKPTTGAGNFRLDEMAYDPTDNEVLAINDAACPSFGTFFSAAAPYAIIGSVAFPNASTSTGATGVEQPTWDPTQGKFLVAVPTGLTNPGGEVDIVDPKAYTISSVLPTTNCNPNGDALGPNETLFLGCSNVTATAEMLTINAATGATISTIPGFGGCDEVWYSPAVNHYYGACSNNVNGGPALIVANGTGGLINPVSIPAGSHSVAADGSGRAWVPERGNGVDIFAP